MSSFAILVQRSAARSQRRCRDKRAGIAQLVERLLPKQQVAGSRPVSRSKIFGAVAQLGERFHGMEEVRGSTPLSSTRFGVVVQLGERFVRNEEVRGSNPLGSTKFRAVSSARSERFLDMEEVAGSNPARRTKFGPVVYVWLGRQPFKLEKGDRHPCGLPIRC